MIGVGLWTGLQDGHLVDVLFFVAVMALDDARSLVHDGEVGLHGLVVGDALGIVACHAARRVSQRSSSPPLRNF